MKFYVSFRKIGQNESLSLTIPKAIVDNFGFKADDSVVIETMDGSDILTVYMKPKV